MNDDKRTAFSSGSLPERLSEWLMTESQRLRKLDIRKAITRYEYHEWLRSELKQGRGKSKYKVMHGSSISTFSEDKDHE